MPGTSLIVGEFDLETKQIFPNLSTPISFSCQSSVRCCSELHIPITDQNMQRIEKHGYAVDQIVEIQSPKLILPEHLESGIEKYYEIKRKEYVNTCRFLLDNHRCEIYDYRPFGCRVFPFSIRHLTRNRVQIRVHPTNICGSIRTDNKNEEILEDIMNKYLLDLEEKRHYFEIYGNDI